MTKGPSSVLGSVHRQERIGWHSTATAGTAGAALYWIRKVCQLRMETLIVATNVSTPYCEGLIG